MPVEIGYIPAGTPLDALEHGPDVPAGLPSSTSDLIVAAPKTVSALYAALYGEKRHDDTERVAAAHQAGIEAAINRLNRHASAAVVYRWGRHQTPHSRLAEMLEREPDALPERREELAGQAEAELRDPSIVEHVESTGLRINQLFHLSHNDDRGDPHLHTHLFLDAEVTAADDGHDYPRDPSTLIAAVPAVMQEAYDIGMAGRLQDLLGCRFVVSEATARREVVGISDEFVAAYPGTSCIPDVRFHQIYGDRMLRRR